MHDRAEIQRLIIHTERKYGADVRFHVQRLLRSMNFRPPGFPAGAILLINRITGLPPLDISRVNAIAWERVMRQRVQALFRRALRPGPNGWIPADADSVLFQDAAEMIACLTGAIIRNQLNLNAWYWPQVLRGVPDPRPGARLSQLWIEQATALPQGLHLLPAAQQKHAVSLLTRRQISQLITRLHEEYTLPDDVLSVMTSQIEDTTLPRPSVSPFPTEPVAPVAPQLAPEAEYLIGLCRTLHQHPALAQSGEFARQATAWLAAKPAAAAPIEPHEETLPEFAKATHLPDSTAAFAEHKAEAPDAPPRDVNDDSWPVQLGGVFYLIHLLNWLDLPDESTVQLVSGWGVIEAIARFLLVDAGLDFATDAVWRILATLDQRDPNTQLGLGYEPISSYRIPPAWLTYLPAPGHWLASIVAGRIRVIDPNRDYLVMDIPAHDKAVLQGELVAYYAQAPTLQCRMVDALPQLPVVQLDNLAPGLDYWIQRTGTAIRAVLAHHLRCKVAEVWHMLQKPARIRLSHTHIDLYLPMTAVNVDVRRAGLDLNPGWQAKLGYIIQFHYNGT